MAVTIAGQTLEQIRNSNLTSLYGRRLGVTQKSGANTQLDEYIGGPKDLVRRVQSITTTVPTTVNADGMVAISGLGSSQGPVQHNLPIPVPGVELQISLACTSTGSMQFLSTPNGASIVADTAGTTVGVVNLVGPGGGIVLFAASTTVWLVTGRSGSTAGGIPLYSTST